MQCACMYVFIYIHVYIHKYIHTCIHTYVHTYTHVLRFELVTCTSILQHLDTCTLAHILQHTPTHTQTHTHVHAAKGCKHTPHTLLFPHNQ